LVIPADQKIVFKSTEDTNMSISSILPRVIRLRDAPKYLGMDKNRFNREVRPNLEAIPIGIQGIGFDRLDLDAWFDHYKKCNGRPASNNRRQIWDENTYQGYKKSEAYGISIRESTAADFAKVLEQVNLKKQRST
jgi:hypothetical protein